MAFLFTGQFLNGSGFYFAKPLVAGHLVTDAVGFLDSTGKVGLDGIQQLGVLGGRLPVPTGLADFSSKFLDGGNRCLHFLMTIKHAAQHLVFGQAFGFGFNHQNRVFSTGNDHIQQGGLQFFKRRVQEVTALVGVTHAGRTDGAIERNTGDGQSGRRRQHRGNIRVLVLAGGHDRGDDLNFVHEAVREQRTNRTVDQA